MERLQKVIAQTGYCSRRKAEELIAAGLVSVNGKIINEKGYKASLNDSIVINNEVLNNKEDKVYYILNKPRGIITSVKDEKGRKTVVDLIRTDKRIYPVGRLDYDTTGLVLLTNDGELTNYISHPKNSINKTYIAKINGIPLKEEIIRLERGIIIEGKKTSKAKLKIIKIDKKNSNSLIQIIIHEGRNHQIKKMFSSIGYDVIKLKREKLGFLDLNGLNSGDYRELSVHEVKKLYNEAQKN